MKTLPVGVQVYSVRDFAEKDFLGTMKKIKALGYDGVELAGTYGHTAEEIRGALDEAGIAAISAHVPLQELREDLTGTLQIYKTIGVKYIAIPYLQEADRPEAGNFDAVLKDIETICKACKEMGIIALYHNHDFEFFKMPDGRYALDYMYETIPADLLQTELDTCWVKVSKEDPAAYVRKYSGRAPVVHLKDFQMEGDPANMYELIGTEVRKEAEKSGSFEFRPVGSGMQNFPAILEAAIDAGSEWVIVEQDQAYGQTSFEAIEDSRKYLKSLGW